MMCNLLRFNDKAAMTSYFIAGLVLQLRALFGPEPWGDRQHMMELAMGCAGMKPSGWSY
jgi:hypothetical protein